MLAATLAQAPGLAPCPRPPTRYGPPPCAASPVPGCLPGYRRRVDAWGRVTYVCDPAPVQAPPPPTGVPSPPPAAVPPPPPAAVPPPPSYAPPIPPDAPPYLEPATRGVVGFVAMGGATTRPETSRDGESVGAVGLELRAPAGGVRLRLGLEYAPFGYVAEAAFKYDFNDRGPVRPFLAVGLGGADVDPAPGWRLEVNAAAGLDLYLTRDLFFTAELKRRAFAQRADVTEFTDLHQTALFVGIGVFL
jgi:hypothetical protein